jgi:hypothetical protein
VWPHSRVNSFQAFGGHTLIDALAMKVGPSGASFEQYDYDAPGQLRDVLLSPRNLLQLVDLLVGVDVDPSSVARLLWSVQAADERAIVKDYLIARALPHYNAALVLKMGDLLDRYVDRILREANLEKVNLKAVSTQQRAVTSKFMDRVETEVFASLADEVRKLEEKIKRLEQSQSLGGQQGNKHSKAAGEPKT